MSFCIFHYYFYFSHSSVSLFCSLNILYCFLFFSFFIFAYLPCISPLQLHMMELMETVCESMKDYAQARHKETGRLEAIRLVVDGAMNPRFSEYEMVQDPDLNKGLEFHCNTLVEEFEDELVAHFRENAESDVEGSQQTFCYEVSDVCTGVKDEL